MSEDPAEPPRVRGQALIDAAREDLDLYAVDELKDRIETLRAEINRTQARMDFKLSGRAAADALFKRQ
jgi:uncharacterized small protein (DUF1192 family)